MVADGASWARVDLAAMRAADSHAVSVAALYDAFDAAGLQYGPGYRALLHAWGPGGEGGAASARLRARRSARDGTTVHPAELDGALRKCGMNVDERQLRKMFDEADLDRSGGIVRPPSPPTTPAL